MFTQQSRIGRFGCGTGVERKPKLFAFKHEKHSVKPRFLCECVTIIQEHALILPAGTVDASPTHTPSALSITYSHSSKMRKPHLHRGQKGLQMRSVYRCPRRSPNLPDAGILRRVLGKCSGASAAAARRGLKLTQASRDPAHS